LEYQNVFSAGAWSSRASETVNSPHAAREWLVVSAHMRTHHRLRNAYNWLNGKRPIALIGGTLFVYDITSDIETIEQLQFIYRIRDRPRLYERQTQRLRWTAGSAQLQ
jgi:hypothetical protein